MFTFSKCDFCPAKEYYCNVYRISYSDFKKGISPLDCEFLFLNLDEYNLIRHKSSATNSEKKHAIEQIKRIIWVFTQFGIPEEMIFDAMPRSSRGKMLSIIVRETIKK